MKPKSRTLNIQDFNAAQTAHVVVAWYRDETCLYVGVSGKGYHGFVKDKTLGLREEYDAAQDRIDAWECVNNLEAAQLAAELIVECKPLFIKTTPQLELVECKQCKGTFLPNRPWQDFCTPACRTVYAKAHSEQVPKEEKSVLKVCAHCKRHYNLLLTDIQLDRSYLCPECRAIGEPTNETTKS